MLKPQVKILIIRFSSIGDIVLTTPVVRCLKKQVENIELHYATKKQYEQILVNNPYIDKLHLLENDLSPLINLLKIEEFDYIIDLHNNLRSRIIKLSLGVKSFAFNKLNFKKFLLTNFKINKMPAIHIVDRYLETVKQLGVKNDSKGLDYFIAEKDEINLIENGLPKDFIAFVIGAKFSTKRLPENKIIEICNKINTPVVFLGGKEDKKNGDSLVNKLKHKEVYNACGSFNLNQSASIIRQSFKVITHDTGLMHIAAAFQKNIISIWGNTLPDLGMYQYVADSKKTILEVKGLPCRPCSKIGYNKCPKKHFDCMNKIDVDKILTALN